MGEELLSPYMSKNAFIHPPLTSDSSLAVYKILSLKEFSLQISKAFPFVFWIPVLCMFGAILSIP